jgi:hypothetical protein
MTDSIVIQLITMFPDACIDNGQRNILYLRMVGIADISELYRFTGF